MMEATLVSSAKYLERLAASPVKLEWVGGLVTEMAGASRSHGILQANLARVAGVSGANPEWFLFGSDVEVKASNSYRFPDASLVHRPRSVPGDIAILLNPVALIEITSPSTQGTDRGTKLREYRQIESLRHYVIIEGDVPSIDVYSRQGDVWTVRTSSAGVLELEGTPVQLNLDELYRHAFDGFEP